MGGELTNDDSDDIDDDEDYENLPWECVTRSDTRDTTRVTHTSQISKEYLGF